MQQATTDNVEWSLSESSPGQPAMARPAMERPGGDLPPSGRFRRSPASSTSRGRTRLTMRSPSTNGKRNASRLSPLARRPPARMDSPAVERVEISRHRVVRPELSLGTAGPDAVESRLAALEQQQSFDHKYLEQIAAAVRSLYEAQEWERLRRNEVDEQSITLDMNMRRDLAATNQELQSLYNKVPGMANQELEHFFGFGRGVEIIKRADLLEEKVLTIQKVLNEIQGKGAKVEDYLEKLHEERPKEGQAVVELVNNQVSQVREMVSRFEPPRGDHQHPTGIPFTQAMSNTLKEMHEKIMVHEATLMNQANHEQRILATETQVLQTTEYLNKKQQDEAGAPKPTGFSMCGAYSAGLAAAAQRAGTGTGTGTSSCHGGTPTEQWGFGTGPGAGGVAPPGIPGIGTGTGTTGGAGSSGDGDPQRAVLAAVIGGNGQCHCVHVKTLIGQVAALEARAGGGHPAEPGRGLDPWHSGLRRDGAPSTGTGPPPAGHAADAPSQSLPLKLKGPLGAINFKDRGIFDEKLATQAEYKFDGVRGGVAWKGKTERHFISRAPIIKDVLKWAEECELEVITVEKFLQAVGGKLDEDQVLSVNAALWGFLSAAVSGTAETMFRNADTLNGLDAWRRLSRFVNHGKAIRLETLRREVKTLHLKPITSLSKVEEGVAEWENTLNEYVLAGGTPTSDAEKKSDLLAVLPHELQADLLWRSTDAGSFQEFRDHVLTQTSKILMNQKKLPIHAVDEGSGDDGDEDGFTDIIAAIQKFQHDGCDADLVAAVQRFQRGGGGRFQRRSPGGTPPPPPRPAEDRPPRKCPNCGKTHAGRCTAAPVSPADRPCWTCNKRGHVSRNCPDKKREGSAVKAVDDRRSDHVQACFSVTDEEGFKTAASRQRAAPTGRPMPTTPTFGDFLDKNKFAALSTTDPSGSGARSRVPADEPVPAKPPRNRRRHIEPDLASVDPLASLPVGRPGYHRASSQGSAQDLRRALAEAQRQADERIEQHIIGGVNAIYDEEEDHTLAAVAERVMIRPAMDSGSVANVLHPSDLPAGAEPAPNTTGRHFAGAGGGRIERFGTCETLLEGEHGAVTCKWQLADVTRPLHSVGQVTGPVDGPGKTDVLFNNERCVVVPPGIVAEILKKVKPIAEYKREGNLYVADMTMSGFTRQGQAP